MKTQSSNVDCVLTHADDLYVRFHSGKCYKYIGAGHLYYEMIGAESVGSFLNREVKPNFEFATVDEEFFDKLETESTPTTLLCKFQGGRNCFF